ncbi:MAG TPA: hypothetical protein VJ276_04180 [Thermoanaerobaculia bacterium]|nr:hypothetical protein [Thermoanaerobaculia bacterium]
MADVLREHDVDFEPFRLNVGAKRGFWTSFMLNGREHILAVYPDELNILAGPDLYENYLTHEFESGEIRIASFARRLTRLLEEGKWELPEEESADGSHRSSIVRAVMSFFRKPRDRRQ